MERNIKTLKEIFWKLYPATELVGNPLKCVEAIGWLKCTKQYTPTYEQWVNETIIALIDTLSTHLFKKEEPNSWEEVTPKIAETIDEVLEIIDDALCFGFEFKVENHKIWFRETSDTE